MADYIADPCPEPSLSKSGIGRILYRSPQHAMRHHPRLGPNPERYTPSADTGSAAHAELLGADETQQVVWVEAKDWRTKAAKEERDEAHAAGCIAMLEKDRQKVVDMAAISQQWLIEAGPGQAEQTMVWQMGGVYLRTRPDYLHDDQREVNEYKTSTSADPAKWARIILNSHYDIQATMPLMALDALFGEAKRDYRWLVQEVDPPYCCSWVGLGPQMEAMAREKIHLGATIWAKCLADKQWPGYDKRTHWVDPTGYDELDWEIRKQRWSER